LYRTICELVNNSLQHSNAKNIKIELTSSDSIIDLIYEDNGKGFDVNKVLHENTRGTGLRNMVSRIESVNGTYKFENKSKTGFKASFSIHIGRRHDKA